PPAPTTAALPGMRRSPRRGVHLPLGRLRGGHGPGLPLRPLPPARGPGPVAQTGRHHRTTRPGTRSPPRQGPPPCAGVGAPAGAPAPPPPLRGGRRRGRAVGAAPRGTDAPVVDGGLHFAWWQLIR